MRYKMINIHGIEAFSDNYIWCLSDKNGDAIIVDPGCANTVEQFLYKNNLKLKAILVTHHHHDHIGGVKQLKAKYSPEIYGYIGAKFDFLDHKLSDNEQFEILQLKFRTLEVPGHTLDHIAFYVDIPTLDSKGNTLPQPSLFCGDTLFSAGCGRIFEGTAEQMFNSLKKLSSLPSNTLIYCAHEYTLSNLAFAKSLMPKNKALSSYMSECEEKRYQGLPTIPTTLSTELQINPFLRHDDPEIFSSLKSNGLITEHNDLEIFRLTRKAKDTF
jgi:hydroxyacylglutathione hydrolase